MLQIVIYKKLNFWEEYTPLITFAAFLLKVKVWIYSQLSLILLIILKLEQAQRGIFCQHFDVEVKLIIYITFAWSLGCLQNEEHGQKRKCVRIPGPSLWMIRGSRQKKFPKCHVFVCQCKYMY